MKTFRTTAAFFLALALCAVAAPVAWHLPFQGVATDSTGRPRPDGAVNVTFALFDAATAGNSVWSELDAVNVKKGLLSLQLGSVNALPLNLLGRQNLWLQVTFGSEPAVSPRIPLGRNVEAWYAHTADTASYAAKAPLSITVKAPLVLSAGSDTLKLKPGTATGNFLTWDGTNWVAKTTTYTTSIAGGSQPLPIRNPYLGVNFIIALQGIFPSPNGTDAFIGEIEMAGFNFAPKGWAMCNGQMFAISQNEALFSLLGTTYGGNGQTTFALPNLQSRVPMHFGLGNGLSQVQLGEMGGSESVTIGVNQMPAHNHVITTTP